MTLGRLHQAEAAVFDDAGVTDLDLGVLGARGSDTTDVEGAHRELRAGLADRLGGDDADGVTDLRDLVGRGIDAVGLGVDTLLARGGERREHLDALDAGIVDALGEFLGDEVAGVRRSSWSG